MNLTHTVLDRLGRAIVSGEFDGAGFPTESQLAQQLGVSHNITREVVKMLTAKGLLLSRSRVGTLVEPKGRWNLLDPDVLRWLTDHRLSPDLLLTLTEMRLAVEPVAAALAARRADAEARVAIVDAIGRLRAAGEGFDDPAEAAIAFHVAILAASKNPFFLQLRELVGTALRIAQRVRLTAVSAESGFLDHTRIAEAILAGDGAAAQERMTASLTELIARLPTGRVDAADGPDGGPRGALDPAPASGRWAAAAASLA